MYFQHSPQIWSDFPTLQASVIAIDNISNSPDVSAFLDPFYNRVRTRLKNSQEGDMPEIDAWRRAYSQMNLKPTKYRCAAESLLRRFRKDDSLPSIHPIIDLCNALSMTYAAPIAVYDRSKIAEGIEVQFAKGTEEHLAFSGEIEHPEEGEVAFIDEAGHAHSRRWCFRQSKHSAIMPDTSEVLIVCESLHDSAAQDLEMLTQELVTIASEVWGPPVNQQHLFSNRSRFEY